MQPHLAPGIEKATRKQFPEGIAAYGTDALRFTFASLATQSRDIRFDLGARRRATATSATSCGTRARFVLMMTEGEAIGARCAAAASPARAVVADRWILSRLGETLRDVDAAFAEYRFDYAATALYEFTWHEFCDWYLELAKPVLQGEDAAAARAARAARCSTCSRRCCARCTR